MKKHCMLATIVAFSLLWPATVSGQQTAEELYQAGLYQEEVQGNLERAIDVYRQILEDFPDNRAVGARAQLHVGLCYEKLGLQEAQHAYRRVIDDYPEHTDEVAVARTRLASLERAVAELGRQPTFRRIEIASKPRNGVLSPDGKRLAFVSEGAVWVVPLQGNVGPDIAGEPVRLAEVPGVWDNGSLMAWSADGEWIAVNGGSEDGALDAVSVIPVGGGEPRVLRVPDRGRNAGGYRLGLSLGGRTLAISAIELDTEVEAMDVANRRIYTIPTVGGELQLAWSGPARQPSFAPDGRHIAFVGYRETDDWEENTQRPPPYGDLLVAPSSGGNPVKLASLDGGRLIGPVWSPDGKYIAAHYGQGYHSESQEIWVYRVLPDASSAGEPTKIPLPRSSWHMLAGWTPDDELGVFMRSEEHQAVYTVPARGGRALQVTPGVAWPNDPRWSPDGERIYFAGRDEERDRNATYYVPADGGDPVMVPLPEQWQTTGSVDLSPDGKTIVMSVNPGNLVDEGFDLWTIPLQDGRPTRVTSDGSPKDYPSWSPDGRWVAYVSYGRQEEPEDEGYVAVYVVPAEGGESRQVTARVDSVRASGVTFTPDAERIVFFSDGAIKTIPVEGGQSETLVTGIESGGDSKLAYSPDGSKIAHNVGGKIWITPLATGVPEELRTRLPEDARLGGFCWSPDGEKIVFTASMGGEQEFWLISDFLPEER